MYESRVSRDGYTAMQRAAHYPEWEAQIFPDSCRLAGSRSVQSVAFFACNAGCTIAYANTCEVPYNATAIPQDSTSSSFQDRFAASLMDIIKKLTELTFSPIGIMTILTASGLVLSIFSRRPRAGRRLLIWGGLLFVIFLFTPLAEYLILSLERPYPPMLSPPSDPKITRIVVLAGYAEDNPGFPITSNVSAETLCRMSEGLRLYRLLPKAALILSGGVAREGDKPVAAMMADFLEQMGVPTKDLIVEGKSRNTFENLLEVKKLVGSDPFILVTAACDLRRAMAVARKLEMAPVPAPACIRASQYHPKDAGFRERTKSFLRRFIPSLDNFSKLQWAYHEYLGYIWYVLLGRI